MKLLEKEDSKVFNLLMILLEERFNDELSIPFLAKKTGTDRRIIRKYLERLIEDNMYINTTEKLALYITDSGNIHISIPLAFDENTFVALYSERSICFKLVIDLLTGSFTSLEAFAEKNFISVPAIYKKFSLLKKYLADLNIDLDLKTKKKFIGLERQIRLFYFYLLLDIQEYLTLPDFLMTDGNKRYEDYANLWLTISYFRILTGNYIAVTDELDAVQTFPISKLEFAILFRKDIKHFFEPFSLSKETLLLEKQSLCLVFNILFSLHADMDRISKIKIPKSIDQFETFIEKSSFRWVQLFIDFFQLSVSQKEFNYMYQMLLNSHSIMFILNNNQSWIFRNSNYDQLKKGHPYLESVIDDFYPILEKGLNFDPSHKILLSDKTITYTFLLHNFFSIYVPKFSVYVISKTGSLNTFYLKSMVEKVTITPISFSDDPQKSNLIITDTYGPFVDGIPTIHVHTILQEAELQLIKSTIEKKYAEISFPHKKTD